MLISSLFAELCLRSFCPNGEVTLFPTTSSFAALLPLRLPRATMASSSTTNDPSIYLDYATFTDPTFSPTAYANRLVLQTNNPSDTPLDLSTPLARVLFDAQEVDTHIDALTTAHALPLVELTRERREASSRVLETVEQQVQGLSESYARMEREVIDRVGEAEEVRRAAEGLVRTVRLGRGVLRVLQLGRQLEGSMEGLQQQGQWRVMVPAAKTLLGLRALLAGEEGVEVVRVGVVGQVRDEVLAPAEKGLVSKSQQVVREFSMSWLLASASGGGGGQQGQGQAQQTHAQTEETKNRATSALRTLYLLSPTKASTTLANFEPTLLIAALQSYLQTALTASLAAMTRALATLPTLDRTLLEISARCQNIVALEALLASTTPPPHPTLPSGPTTTTTPNTSDQNFLQPLLRHLDTSSLPSYFWRTLASQLSSRVSEILARGGVSARTLRSNRERVREMVRECVGRGSQLPVSALGTLGRAKGAGTGAGWEREAAVMVGSVIGPLGR